MTATFVAMPVAQLTIVNSGSGVGTVTSNPAGIQCGATCKADFNSGTSVTLTAVPASGSTFAGWSGSCTGNAPCTIALTADTTITATFNTSNTAGLNKINHIIFLAEEHHSFDNYFGAMRDYWAKNGYPDQSFDGLPQFNPASGAAPLTGPAPAIPGCDPKQPPPADCAFDPNTLVTSFHLMTQCTENASPSWNEAHVDWNYYDQLGLYPAQNNGVVFAAGHDARFNDPPYNDSDGLRAMGYYNGDDLNYYYFMASHFATSDRFFHPVMTRTQPNRHFLIAATSQGRVYPNGTGSDDGSLLTAKTIFQALQDAGITWRIYVNTDSSKCTGPPYDPSCLLTLSYVKDFAWGQTIPTAYPNNIAPLSQYFTDLQNGTLPQVVQIEPSTLQNLDEHGTTYDAYPNHIQQGAMLVSTLINGVMNSSSWKDSVFILTYDEFGGLYDHVPPQPAISPDGIKPLDLLAGDACTKGTGPICDFTYTGYRIPLLVVSPYTRKNYVSHTVADSTAILKFIESRFGIPALTNRDAAQPDMTEFFDFNNPPWITPPSPPTQNTTNPCYLTQLP